MFAANISGRRITDGSPDVAVPRSMLAWSGGWERRGRRAAHERTRRRPGRELFRCPHSQFSNESPGTFEKWRVLFVTSVHLSATA